MLKKTLNFFKKYGTWLLLAINIAVITGIIITDPDFKEGFLALNQMRPVFIALCFVVFSLTFVCEGAQLFFILRMFGQRYSLFRSIRAIIIERYYSNITPTNVGGQPALIFHLIAGGLSGTMATSATSVRFILYQFTVVTFLVASLILLPILEIALSPIVTTSLIIGIVGTASVPLLLLLCVIWPKITYRLISWLCKGAKFLHFTRDADRLYGKVVEMILQYSRSMKMINLRYALVILLFAVLQFFAIMSVPFFACFACQIPIRYIQSVVLTLVLYTAVGFIPTPGNSGAAEAMFFTLFNNVIPSSFIMVAMLLWRVSSYYFTIILGLLESGYTAIASAVRRKKARPQ